MALDLDELVAMGLFVHVVELRSFTEAARRTGLSKSVVSRRVAALEDRLGTRLLNRTTRRLSLTEPGVAFYERCARMLAEAAEAEDAVAALSREPRGLVRVAAPVALCHLVMMPAFASFLAEHPGTRIEVSASDRMDDVVGEGYDVALRVGQLTDSSLVARRLADVPFAIVASPAYLERRGRPTRPEDLMDHATLHYTGVASHQEWRFAAGASSGTVLNPAPFQTDNATVLREATRAGIGVTVLPRFVVGDLLASGELVEVLQDHPIAERSLYAVLPHRRNASPKVVAFVSYIARWLGTHGLCGRPTSAGRPRARSRGRGHTDVDDLGTVR